MAVNKAMKRSARGGFRSFKQHVAILITRYMNFNVNCTTTLFLRIGDVETDKRHLKNN